LPLDRTRNVAVRDDEWMGQFDDETAVRSDGDGRWVTMLSSSWNIGENANGGYAAAAPLRALIELTGQPDPMSVTTHFLRPVDAAGPAAIGTELVRRGRTASVARATLAVDDDRPRLSTVGAFGDLTQPVGTDGELTLSPPDIAPPERCVPRAELHQGVELPILDRVDVVIDPDCAVAAGSDRAVVTGWVRLADGSDPTPLALTFFADVFPPALYPLMGRVGWMPTIELTVHVRRLPTPGWVLARFECDDLAGGRMIETGSLWDSTGTLVARSRQLGLVLTG
jgi:acyl-CoA thioesterase